jgi:hypothetical protein
MKGTRIDTVTVRSSFITPFYRDRSARESRSDI